MKTFLLIISVFILSGRSSMAQPPLPQAFRITSDTAASTFLPRAYWQFMADSAGKQNLREVLRTGYFEDTGRIVDYKIHTYWIRFRLINSMSKETEIALPVNAARVDLYTRMNDEKWRHYTTGKMVHWSRRDGLKKIPALTLTIPAGATLTIYKRVYWDYIMTQPDSMTVYFTSAKRLVTRDYIADDSMFMTSIQAAFILGLFVLSILISFYFFLVVREKEFLYFSLFLLMGALESVPTLHDVFLREHPHFVLYLYIISNSVIGFGLIHSLRQFLKTFKWFPVWDKILVIFSFLQVFFLLLSHFASSIFHINLSALSHFTYNLFMLVSAVFVLATLFLYLRKHDKAVRLMIIAFTPILILKIVAYLIALIYGLYYPRLGEPAVSGYAVSFNKVAFFILIITYLWMIGLFNRVLFLRFSDIRKMLERQTTLDHLKSRFFANISHEFRTPLTLLMGPLEDVMRKGDAGDLTPFVPEMYRNSKRLLQLINQLLDLSRLDAGSYPVNTSREDIIPFTAQIVHSFTSLAKRKNIHLEMEVDPALKTALQHEDLRFYFDEDMMEKIWNNLLSNAFKFTPDGGAITAGIKRSGNRANFLELSVKDTGKGIPADKLDFIFERFYEGDHYEKGEFESSGVGLALLKELVDLLQGEISVKSSPGEGATFYCCLPFNKKIVSEKRLTAVEPVNNAVPEILPAENNDDIDQEKVKDKCYILIVEDHQDVRKYIREKLKDVYGIIEAVNGKEGLELALAQMPDLVISDVMMPEMDGFKLCEQLKTHKLTSHIPVILLTARAEDSDKMAGLETGADAYLIKPFNSQELKVRVKNLIQIRNKMRTKFSKKLMVKPSEITITSVDQQFMQKLLSVMEAHIGDSQFSVDQLAGAMSMSPSQLYRKLKALINQSTQQFIRSVRMQRALELLKRNSGTISEISWEVGFEDPGYFTKVFKKQFGCLPTDRKNFPV